MVGTGNGSAVQVGGVDLIDPAHDIGGTLADAALAVGVGVFQAFVAAGITSSDSLHLVVGVLDQDESEGYVKLGDREVNRDRWGVPLDVDTECLMVTCSEYSANSDEVTFKPGEKPVTGASFAAGGAFYTVKVTVNEVEQRLRVIAAAAGIQQRFCKVIATATAQALGAMWAEQHEVLEPMIAA